jgi:hypothetical protein
MAHRGLGRPSPSRFPFRRPDTVVAPGSSAGIFRGRLVLVFGPSGTVTGVFVYRAGTTPAPGNPPIFWATSAAADPYGNPIPSTAGVAGTGTFQAGNTIINPGGEFIYSGTPALGNLIASLASAADADRFTNNFPQGLMGQQLTLLNRGAGPPAFAGASVFYSAPTGRPRYLSSAGADNVLERSDVNTASFPIGNTGTPTNISAPLNYLAGEGSLSSEYEIEIDGTIGTGSVTAQTLTFELAIDGGAVLGGAFTIGAVYLAINLSFEYTIRFRLTITATGFGGTANMASDGCVNRSGANLGGAANTTLSVGAVGTGKVFDTTIAHTIQAMAFWGGSSTGQQLNTVRTRITRRF